MIKPFSDNSEYRYIELNNGLKVLLVSSPLQHQAAAALAVKVGSANNKDINGLAHLLEHMLFLGSKKYPSDKSFKSILAQNMGKSNAMTSDVLSFLGNHHLLLYFVQNQKV